MAHAANVGMPKILWSAPIDVVGGAERIVQSASDWVHWYFSNSLGVGILSATPYFITGLMKVR